MPRRSHTSELIVVRNMIVESFFSQNKTSIGGKELTQGTVGPLKARNVAGFSVVCSAPSVKSE